MEDLCIKIFDTLNIKSYNHPIIMAEVAMTPKRIREKMTVMMFETFEVPKLYFANQDQLGLSAMGRGIGCMVDIGESFCSIVPIYIGAQIFHQAIKRINLGGQDIDKYLRKLLISLDSLKNVSIAEEDIIREIKEKLAYIALDIDRELQILNLNAEQTIIFNLSNGLDVRVGKECLLAPELFFNPSLIGKSLPSISKVIIQSINQCDAHTRLDFYNNILLTGGSTLIPGFPERLQKELQELKPSILSLNVVAPTEREYYTWIGGSILGSLKNMEKWWITNEEYKKVGAHIAHRCIEQIKFD